MFHVGPSRGSVVLETILGLDYAGMISCDSWEASKKFERMTSAALQPCWARPIREVRFLAESKAKATARCGNRFLKKIRGMFSTIHRRDALSERTWRRQMRSHRESVLKMAWGTIPDDKDAINITERLWNGKAEYFRFIDEKIPPTNNLGGQTIREVVIDRKVTQGTRSDWVNRWPKRFWSVLSACEQQGNERDIVPEIECRVVSSWSRSSIALRRLILLFFRNFSTVCGQSP